MRRLLLLLIGLMALGTMTPAVAAAPVRMDGSAPTMAMPAGHCPDSAPGRTHACLGCAVQPDAMPAPRSVPARPAVPTAIALIVARPRHPTGFDPPPPRG